MKNGLKWRNRQLKQLTFRTISWSLIGNKSSDSATNDWRKNHQLPLKRKRKSSQSRDLSVDREAGTCSASWNHLARRGRMKNHLQKKVGELSAGRTALLSQLKGKVQKRERQREEVREEKMCKYNNLDALRYARVCVFSYSKKGNLFKCYNQTDFWFFCS